MKMSYPEFLDSEHKAIMLIGMSGIGKTTLAYKLPKCSWFHYSVDYRIGTKYLEEPILDNIKKQAMQVAFLRDLLRNDSIYIASNITVHNLEPISAFTGKIGNPDVGGLPVEEFKRRQRLHREAEIAALYDIRTFVDKAHDLYGYPHFVSDAGGSICELNDETVLQSIAEHTVIVYLRADAQLEQTLIERAKHLPKPLYYQEWFLDQNLAEYLHIEGLSAPEEIHPDRFVQWIFPRLLEHRRPLYEAIAARYGYVIEAREAESVRSEQDFLRLLRRAFERNVQGAA